ncbi:MULTISPECIES: response regulator transcription factor [Burkholderia]|uniref:Two-component system response regulator n=1 Tax=Burkholderia contaminans TaxID=488447 RepID=A0A6P3BS74_9BURK|nr:MULTISPECIES: response regulator transcription factor [Burkholderia]AOJ41213.1 two-component system response regulator [Burkholderia lata]MBN3751086.1 response regulator transcription factor [Burkholderia sp. Se-20373]MCA8253027.1 response regulator transcription factor [Burkholderia sp. AU31624]MDN7486335.1 response regulator transcription factor [Burkholderia sp. AU45274]NIE58175.1 response regulator transcription factor [Burkholderia sp. Ap-955]
MRILVVEDDAEIGAAIRSRLARLGHAVDLETDGATAHGLLRVERFDLVVLDANLPGMDGFTVLRHLRASGSTTPVLLVTARSAIDDRVSGLGLGADDYLVKPFDYRELDARVQALLRRNSGHANDVLTLGGLVIDRSSRLAELDGQPLSLSRQEFALLEILASRPQRIFSKDELLNQLFSFGNEPTTNAVEQYVTRVRKKLQGSSVEIRTARGMGYQIAAH